mgnify:CR=1 FL=1
MPKEIRRILFNFSEATQALRDYAHNHDIWLPEGRLARVQHGKKNKHEPHTMRSYARKIQDEQNLSDAGDDIVISFFDESSLDHNYANLSKALIAAALIDYCIANKILLPKEAQKTIGIDELHIFMDIQLNTVSDDDAPILSLEEGE